MQGQLFLITNQNGQLMGQGRIMREIAQGVYQCTMAGNPPVGQIVAAVNMQGWLFFDNEDHLAAWMANNAAPVGDPDAPQEVTAEDLPEGVFDPDSPLTPAEQLADYEAAQSRETADVIPQDSEAEANDDGDLLPPDAMGIPQDDTPAV